MRLKYNKIRKFQYGGTAGGGYYSVPVMNDIPDTYTGSGSVVGSLSNIFQPQKPKINRDQFKPDLSELFKNLKGHTNEVNQIQKIKSSLDQKLSSLSDLDILSQSSNFQKVLQGYSQLMSGALKNQLERSKERTDESFKIAEKKNNLAQMNVKEGKVKVLDKDGKMKEMPLIEALRAKKNGEVVIPTNSKWWQERDTNDNLINNANLSQDLTYGVNIDQVIDKWRKNLSGLGSSEFGGKHSKAIDIVSRGIASGDTSLAQDIMQGSKHDDNFKQVDSALQMSMNAMSQEEIDSLYSFAAGRVLSLGEEPTPENIKKQMYSSMFNLADSKKDASDWSESSVSKVDITDVGKERISQGKAPKMEQVSFVEDARNGRTSVVSMEIADPSKTTAGSSFKAVGFDMGVVHESGKDGLEQLGLMSTNKLLNEPMKPLILQNTGRTPDNKKITDDNFVPKGQAIYTFVLQDRNGNIVGSYDSAKAAQQDLLKKGGNYEIKEKVAVKGYTVSKGKGMWGDYDYEKDVDAGKARLVPDGKLKDSLTTIFNQNVKSGDESKATRDTYNDEGLFTSNDQIVETVVFYDPTENQTWRDKQNKVLYEEQNAHITNQYNNNPSFLKSSNQKTPQQFTTPQ
jgi:hypothetical protein